MNTPTVPFFTAVVEPDGLQCDAWPEQPLLLSMEQGGIHWPSSCRNGTCRTCIGHLAQGQVRYAMDTNGNVAVVYQLQVLVLGGMPVTLGFSVQSSG